MKKTSRSVDSIAWLTRFFTGALVLASFLSTLTLLADGPITVNTSAAQIRADGSIGGIPNLLRPSDNISHRFYVSDTDITEGEEITVISEWYGLENMGSVGGVGVSKFQPDFNFNAFPPPATSAPGYPILTAHGIQGADQACG